MPRCNVVITGLGIVSSIGIGGDDFFQGLLEKRSGITSLTYCNDDNECAVPSDSEPLSGQWIGAPVLDFDAKQFVRPRKALKVMCREIQTAFAASQLAIEQASLDDHLPASDEGTILPKDIGTVFGSEMFYGPPLDMADAVRGSVNEDGKFNPAMFGGVAMKKVTPLWMLKYLPNMPACHVGIAVNAHGPNNTLVLGDVSGAAATVEAISCIERGIAKVVITGATGTRINTTRMLYRCDFPVPAVFDPLERSSRPHDPESTGVVGGEAAASLVLESPEHASERGATPIARVCSYASRFVAAKGMMTPERQRGLEEGVRGSAQSIQLAIEGAIQDAGLCSNDIGLVVSHGTGDPVMDFAERTALAAVVPGVPAVATIASIGHTGAASGSVDLVTAALALAKGVVPPTACTTTTDPSVGFRDRPEALSQSHVLSLSHNSEGSATAMILSAI